jgi:hypothetical protein
MNYVYKIYNDETLARLTISLDVDGEVHVSCEGSIERIVEALTNRVMTNKLLWYKQGRPDCYHEESSTIDRFTSSNIGPEYPKGRALYHTASWYSGKKIDKKWMTLAEVDVYHIPFGYISIWVRGECKDMVEELSKRLFKKELPDFPYDLKPCRKPKYEDEPLEPWIYTWGLQNMKNAWDDEKNPIIWHQQVHYRTEGGRNFVKGNYHNIFND